MEHSVSTVRNPLVHHKNTKMDSWANAIMLIKNELLKEKEVQQKLYQKLQTRMQKLLVAKETVQQIINAAITKLDKDINECKETIEAHQRLIEETENGSFDRQYDSSSDSD